MPKLRQSLQDFVDKERFLRDWVNKGRPGMTTGDQPSINPSTLKILENMLRDTKESE